MKSNLAEIWFVYSQHILKIFQATIFGYLAPFLKKKCINLRKLAKIDEFSDVYAIFSPLCIDWSYIAWAIVKTGIGVKSFAWITLMTSISAAHLHLIQDYGIIRLYGTQRKHWVHWTKCLGKIGVHAKEDRLYGTLHKHWIHWTKSSGKAGVHAKGVHGTLNRMFG